MMRHALDAGAHVYDLRGITETLDADDSHVGLIQFKVGTGGQAVEYAGEWDLPVNRAIYKAFQLYLAEARDEPMSLTLTVDGERWRAHLLEHRPTRNPGIVPVAKGNGYGFTLGRLARRAQWLADHADETGAALDLLAVGTYDEVERGRQPLRRRPAGAHPVAPVRCRARPRRARSPRGSCTPSAAPTTSPPCARATPTPGSCSSSSPRCGATG